MSQETTTKGRMSDQPEPDAQASVSAGDSPALEKRKGKKRIRKDLQVDAGPKLTAEEKLERHRQALQASLDSGVALKLEHRVAAILSRYPESRDSDQTLQFRYWAVYEGDLFGRLQGDPEALYELTPLTSLARARATVQNTYELFQASEPVRQKRKQLSEEEREKKAISHPPARVLTVYADETGKNDGRIVVASVWFVDTLDTGRLWNRVARWKHENNFDGEFHFAEMKGHQLQLYKDFVAVAIDAAPAIAFKSISVSRAGVPRVEHALKRLFIGLLRKGVEHEHTSGRAPLPRRIRFIKDKEQAGPDELFLAELRESIEHASVALFESKLEIDELHAVDSTTQPALQLADLYAGSLNRILNRDASRPGNHKDEFADFMLGLIAAHSGDTIDELLRDESEADLHVRLTL